MSKEFEGKVAKAYERFVVATDRYQMAERTGGTDPESGWSVKRAADEMAVALMEFARLASDPRYASTSSGSTDDHTVIVPLYFMISVSNILQDLCAGKIPDSFEQIFFTRGRRGLSASEAYAVDTAVKYLLLTEQVEGAASAAPIIKEIATLYGVREHTVRKWRRDRAEADYVELAYSSEEMRDIIRQRLSDAASTYKRLKTKPRN